MRSQIVLGVSLRIPQRHAVLLEKGMNLEPGLEAKQAPNLVLRQGVRSVTLNSKRFERRTRDVAPSIFKGGENIVRQIERDLHSHDSTRVQATAW